MVHTQYRGGWGRSTREAPGPSWWRETNRVGGWGTGTPLQPYAEGWGARASALATQRASALATQAAEAHITGLPQTTRTTFGQWHTDRRLARNQPPRSTLFGREQRSTGWVTLDQPMVGPNGRERRHDARRNRDVHSAASYRFWQAHEQSEREYAAATTDDEAYAALYNQQDSWTLQLYIDTRLAEQQELERELEEAQWHDDRDSDRNHEEQVIQRRLQLIRTRDRREADRDAGPAPPQEQEEAPAPPRTEDTSEPYHRREAGLDNPPLR